MNSNSNQLNTINSRSSAFGTVQNSARFGGYSGHGGGFPRESALGSDRLQRSSSNNRSSIERPASSNQVGQKYLQPTVASLNRQKMGATKFGPANLRDRLYELEDAVLEIKTVSTQNVVTLQTQLEKEEKENARATITINSQIQTLKQAIGTLADAVTEELDSLKKQISVDMESTLQQHTLRIEEQINNSLYKKDHEQSKAVFEIQNLKDEMQTLQAIEYKAIEKVRIDLDDKLLSMKADNKKLFEQLRVIIQSNSKQVSTLTKEVEHLEQKMEINRTQMVNINENEQDFIKRLHLLDKDTSTTLKQLSQEMIDIKSLLKDQDLFNTALKNQLEQLSKNLDIKNQTYTQSLSEQTQTLQIKSESIEKQIRKLKQEQENSSTLSKELIKQQLSQLQQKLDLSEQGKLQFEQSIQRKLGSVEDLFETQRKELFASMTDLEKILSKKNDNVTRAIREITQQLNITNPLLTY